MNRNESGETVGEKIRRMKDRIEQDVERRTDETPESDPLPETDRLETDPKDFHPFS